MGIATTTSEKGSDLDPTLIFGVIPSNLQNIPQSQGGYGRKVTTSMADKGDQSNRVDGSNSIYRRNSDDNNHRQKGKATLANQEFLRRVEEMGTESDSPFNIMNASPIMNNDGGYHATSKEPIIFICPADSVFPKKLRIVLRRWIDSLMD